VTLAETPGSQPRYVRPHRGRAFTAIYSLSPLPLRLQPVRLSR